MQVMQAMPARFFETFAVLGLFMLIAVIRVSNAEDSTGILTLGAFVAAAYKIIPGIVKILNSTGQMKTFGFATDALLKNSTVKTTESISINTPVSSVAFKKVFFSYKGEPVLSNFSFDIEKGDIHFVKLVKS